jgi:hypothetical protein
MNTRSALRKIASTTPVAAKPYKCMICGNLIPQGERHHRVVWYDTEALEDPVRFARYHQKCPPLSPDTEY